MQIDAKTTVCGVIGNPIGHSLSPAMHNGGYEALGIHFVYVAFNVKDVKKAVEGIRALNIRGVSVTIPHKETVMRFLDRIDPLAERIGAVNTILNEEGRLTGFNTDFSGALRALKEKTTLHDKHIVILGSGGAAKAIAFGLKEKGARLHIMNKTLLHAQKLAESVGATYSDLNDDEKIQSADILINATSVGMAPQTGASVMKKDQLNASQIVMDIVYNPMETMLLREAKEIGCVVVYGYKMLLYQAIAQFELFTNRKAPVEIMEKALLKGLGHTYGRK